MTNSIRTISVPSGGEADRILTEWANDGRNVSEMTRQAVESWVRLDAMKRRILALEWVVAKRGVCPTLLEPPEFNSDNNHKCELCEDRIGMFGGIKRLSDITAEDRRWIQWRQDTLNSLMDMWRGH